MCKQMNQPKNPLPQALGLPARILSRTYVQDHPTSIKQKSTNQPFCLTIIIAISHENTAQNTEKQIKNASIRYPSSSTKIILTVFSKIFEH
jgi:hypothetical protein